PSAPAGRVRRPRPADPTRPRCALARSTRSTGRRPGWRPGLPEKRPAASYIALLYDTLHGARLVRGQEKDLPGAGELAGAELFFQPAHVPSAGAEIVGHDAPVIDEEDGEHGLVLDLGPQDLGGDGALPGIGEDGDFSVGFQDRVLHGAQIRDALAPQLFIQLVDGEAGFVHILLDQPALSDDDGGLAAEDAAKAHGFQIHK